MCLTLGQLAVLTGIGGDFGNLQGDFSGHGDGLCLALQQANRGLFLGQLAGGMMFNIAHWCTSDN
ncbi:hypothetical protein D3C71_1719270 [compost metagenome]